MTILEHMKKVYTPYEFLTKVQYVSIPTKIEISYERMKELIEEDVIHIVMFKSFFNDKYCVLKGAEYIENMYRITDRVTLKTDITVEILYASDRTKEIHATDKCLRMFGVDVEKLLFGGKYDKDVYYSRRI